jgi:starch phosphorylase
MAKKEPDSIFFTDKEDPTSFSLSNQFAEHLEFTLVKDKNTATGADAYNALSLAVRDRMVRSWLRTQKAYHDKDVKRVYYLSLEYLMGRILGNALINLITIMNVVLFLIVMVMILKKLWNKNTDMGLGNGGLGRLAACYLDSMATLQLPAFGYGIRYEYGIFEQDIENGYQVERADNWLRDGNPWDLMRRNLTYKVKFYGKTDTYDKGNGELGFKWVNTENVLSSRL